jgi:hypothetical protein
MNNSAPGNIDFQIKWSVNEPEFIFGEDAIAAIGTRTITIEAIK